MKIGIFIAMEKEMQPFLQSCEVTTMQCGQFIIHQTALEGKQIYMCQAPYVGEICAAAAVQLLITKFGVDCILNFGVVGALCRQASLMSALLVGEVVHYQMDTSVVDNCGIGRYMCFDSTEIKCDTTLLQKALQIQNLPVVRCASADKFVDSVRAKNNLHRQFAAHICDMESAGILITCKMNNVPCLMVKTVSDSFSGGYDEYKNNVATAAQAFFGFAKQLIAAL